MYCRSGGNEALSVTMGSAALICHPFNSRPWDYTLSLGCAWSGRYVFFNCTNQRHIHYHYGAYDELLHLVTSLRVVAT